MHRPQHTVCYDFEVCGRSPKPCHIHQIHGIQSQDNPRAKTAQIGIKLKTTAVKLKAATYCNRDINNPIKRARSYLETFRAVNKHKVPFSIILIRIKYLHSQTNRNIPPHFSNSLGKGKTNKTLWAKKAIQRTVKSYHTGIQLAEEVQ